MWADKERVFSAHNDILDLFVGQAFQPDRHKSNPMAGWKACPTRTVELPRGGRIS
jgi:hypothetical protein